MSIIKISAQNIQKILSENSQQDERYVVIVEESLPSTNDYLMQLVTTGKASPKTVVLAEEQTLGKGRNGKHWVSVPGNIQMSVYWKFAGSLDKLYGLSLVVGIAIARVLKRNGLKDVQLKWPNDIYWQSKKMGGILIETKQNAQASIDTIIGIGLNIVKMTQHTTEIHQGVAALEEALAVTVSRDTLIAELLQELTVVLNEFVLQGFNVFLDEWKSLDSKIMSESLDMDLYSKIINAEKIKHSHDDKFLH